MNVGKLGLAKTLLAAGVPPEVFAKRLGVSVPTLYRWVPASEYAWRALFSVYGRPERRTSRRA